MKGRENILGVIQEKETTSGTIKSFSLTSHVWQANLFEVPVGCLLLHIAVSGTATWMHLLEQMRCREKKMLRNSNGSCT